MYGAPVNPARARDRQASQAIRGQPAVFTLSSYAIGIGWGLGELASLWDIVPTLR
jgi:hypothetical protein